MKLKTSLNQQEKIEALETLNYQIRSCEECPLFSTRNHALTGEGNMYARLMFVALSPGIHEDLHNQMFIGPSGKVFDKLLQSADIQRESVFMTNLIKCMLPKNRKPNSREIKSCAQFLKEEISIIQPEVIVPLGYYAARAVLNYYQADQAEQPNHNARIIFGRLMHVEGQKIYPLPHPASLLYNPSYEPDTREKFKKLTTF